MVDFDRDYVGYGEETIQWEGYLCADNTIIRSGFGSRPRHDRQNIDTFLNHDDVIFNKEMTKVQVEEQFITPRVIIKSNIP